MYKFFILFLISIHSHLFSTVCLNMIVKNESDVIEKCLSSAKPLIDYWLIVDTGSTDGTQQIIREFMKDVPGELHERSWINFAHNRNEAMELAKSKGDYILFIDADEVFKYEPGFHFQKLDQDIYYFTLHQEKAADVLRPSLIKSALPWKWSGVLHESLNTGITTRSSFISSISTIVKTDAPSGRSKDPQKYAKDAALLENALKDEPNNSRYVFYLAQSYMAAANYEKALENYEKRARMPSLDDQETFFAIYNVGQAHEKLGHHEKALESYAKAFANRPNRAEPLYRSAVIYRKMGNPEMAFILVKHALTIPTPIENCVEYTTYDYGILIEYANCALLTHNWKEGLEASSQLIKNSKLPADFKPQIANNIQIASQHIHQEQ